MLAASQGILMLAVELNRTHAMNPQWPGHARFHLVWQNLTTALFSVLVIALLWWPGPFRTLRFFLAASIVAVPLLAFSAAAFCRVLYGGTMADANGVPPVRLSVGGRAWLFDGNTLAVTLGCLTLLISVVTYQ